MTEFFSFFKYFFFTFDAITPTIFVMAALTFSLFVVLVRAIIGLCKKNAPVKSTVIKLVISILFLTFSGFYFNAMTVPLYEVFIIDAGSGKVDNESPNNILGFTYVLNGTDEVVLKFKLNEMAESDIDGVTYDLAPKDFMLSIRDNCTNNKVSGLEIEGFTNKAESKSEVFELEDFEESYVVSDDQIKVQVFRNNLYISMPEIFRYYDYYTLRYEGHTIVINNFCNIYMYGPVNCEDAPDIETTVFGNDHFVMNYERSFGDMRSAVDLEYDAYMLENCGHIVNDVRNFMLRDQYVEIE